MRMSLFNKNNKREIIQLNTELKDIEINEELRNYKYSSNEIIMNKNVKYQRKSEMPFSMIKQNRSVVETETYEHKLNNTEVLASNNRYLQTFQMNYNNFDIEESDSFLIKISLNYYSTFHKNHPKKKRKIENDIYLHSSSLKEFMKQNIKYFIPNEDFTLDKNIFSLNVEEVQKELSIFYKKIETIEMEIIRVIKYFQYILNFIFKNYYLHNELDEYYNSLNKRKKVNHIFKQKFFINSSKIILSKTKRKNLEKLILISKSLNNLKNNFNNKNNSDLEKEIELLNKNPFYKNILILKILEKEYEIYKNKENYNFKNEDEKNSNFEKIDTKESFSFISEDNDKINKKNNNEDKEINIDSPKTIFFQNNLKEELNKNNEDGEIKEDENYEETKENIEELEKEIKKEELKKRMINEEKEDKNKFVFKENENEERKNENNIIKELKNANEIINIEKKEENTVKLIENNNNEKNMEKKEEKDEINFKIKEKEEINDNKQKDENAIKKEENNEKKENIEKEEKKKKRKK